MRLIVLTFTLSLCVVSCLTLTACSTLNARDRERANLYLELGTSYLVRGDYPLALKELLQSEKLDPNNAATQNNLGLAYYVRHRFNKAEMHFQKALKLRPKFTEAENNLGRLYITVGLYKKAIRELKLATADLTYNQPAKSWSNLGQAYFYDRRYRSAKVALARSLRIYHDSCPTMNIYGRTLYDLKNYKSAAQSFDQAIRFCGKSKFDEPHFYSGMSFYKLGEIYKARAQFRELVTLFPSSRYSAQAKKMLEILK